MAANDMRALAGQITELHRDLATRAERTATTATVTLAAVHEPAGLGWAPVAGDLEVADVVPNTAAVLRRRLAAAIRSPRSAPYSSPLAGMVRHRSTATAAVTTLMLLDGTAAAYTEDAAASVAVGDWRRDITPWAVPFELAEALLGTGVVTAPVEAFAERVGVDPWDHDGLSELTAAVCTACTANPAAAQAAGMDAATAALLGSLVACPADLSDILTGRFDPWEPSATAELRWPFGCGAEVAA